jgi:hypothetical protein
MLLRQLHDLGLFWKVWLWQRLPSRQWQARRVALGLQCVLDDLQLPQLMLQLGA